ncbi:MAG: glycosyltransferase family 2 protein [Candidatus Sumerlaeaceae bacterium]|nr:glycosyltransferase family 2 protein [Candidatus Sumerlaeaceae bacterium]
MAPPYVVVVIVNYNGATVLEECLRSLERSTYKHYDVIVVDNASTDNSIAMVERDFPAVQLLTLDSNTGFAGGNNAGIQVAMARGADYIFVLNNDTTVHADCIAKLVERIEESPKIGAVSPLILFTNPADRIWSAGGSYNLWYGTARHFGLRRRAESTRWKQVRPISFATGCAVLYRCEALKEVGTFDESLFMYAEDSDLSYRLRKAGWLLVFEPQALVWHKEAWTTQRTIGREWGLRLCVRNILRVHAKHARWYHKLTFYPCFVWRWLVLAGTNALLHKRVDVIKGIYQGIAAYWRNEQGKPQ